MQYVESTDDTERYEFYPDGTAVIIRYSPCSGKFNKATMKMTEDRYMVWKSGLGLIQDIFPHLDKEEREFILTGYTPEDWEKMFPPEDDDDKDV
jgi:hypothetical protein